MHVNARPHSAPAARSGVPTAATAEHGRKELGCVNTREVIPVTTTACGEAKSTKVAPSTPGVIPLGLSPVSVRPSTTLRHSLMTQLHECQACDRPCAAAVVAECAVGDLGVGWVLQQFTGRSTSETMK